MADRVEFAVHCRESKQRERLAGGAEHQVDAVLLAPRVVRRRAALPLGAVAVRLRGADEVVAGAPREVGVLLLPGGAMQIAEEVEHARDAAAERRREGLHRVAALGVRGRLRHHPTGRRERDVEVARLAGLRVQEQEEARGPGRSVTPASHRRLRAGDRGPREGVSLPDLLLDHPIGTITRCLGACGVLGRRRHARERIRDARRAVAEVDVGTVAGELPFPVEQAALRVALLRFRDRLRDEPARRRMRGLEVALVLALLAELEQEEDRAGGAVDDFDLLVPRELVAVRLAARDDRIADLHRDRERVFVLAQPRPRQERVADAGVTDVEGGGALAHAVPHPRELAGVGLAPRREQPLRRGVGELARARVIQDGGGVLEEEEHARAPTVDLRVLALRRLCRLGEEDGALELLLGDGRHGHGLALDPVEGAHDGGAGGVGRGRLRVLRGERRAGDECNSHELREDPEHPPTPGTLGRVSRAQV